MKYIPRFKIDLSETMIHTNVDCKRAWEERAIATITPP